MSLTKEFFEKINIELVKRKYYNANKVDSLLSEIRAEALALSEENSRLKAQLDTFHSQKAEIGEAVMSAQLLSSEIVQKANTKADEAEAEGRKKAEALIDEARQQAEKLIEEAKQQAQALLDSAKAQEEKAQAIHDELLGCKRQRQEYAVSKVENCFSMLRQRQLDTIDALNLQWQEFLCGLYEDESIPSMPAVEPEADTAEADSVAEAAPADLGEKVDAIAKELDSLDNTQCIPAVQV